MIHVIQMICDESVAQAAVASSSGLPLLLFVISCDSFDHQSSVQAVTLLSPLNEAFVVFCFGGFVSSDQRNQKDSNRLPEPDPLARGRHGIDLSGGIRQKRFFEVSVGSVFKASFKACLKRVLKRV